MRETKLRKYKNKASNLVEKGKYKKALSIYRDILAAFPNDAAMMLKVGDLCKKLDMNDVAISVYSNAAQHYAKGGQLLKGIAVCKLILEVDPEHAETQEILAALYAKKFGALPDTPQKSKDVSDESSLLSDVSTRKVSDFAVQQMEAKALPPEQMQGVATLKSTRLASEDDNGTPSAVPSVPTTLKVVSPLESESEAEFSRQTTVKGVSALREQEKIGFTEHGESAGLELPPPQSLQPESLPPEEITDTDLEEICDEKEMTVLERASRPSEPLVVDFSDILVDDGNDDDEVEVEEDLEETDTELGDLDSEEPIPPSRISQMDTSEFVIEMTRPELVISELPDIPLFSSLDSDSFLTLLKLVPLHRYEPLETIVKEGEEGNSFFVIVSGSVEVTKGDTTIATLEEGAFFGEMALITPGPRQASVITIEPSELLEISKSQLDELGRLHPGVAQSLIEFTEQRLLNNLILTSPLFAPFSDSDREYIVSQFEQCRFYQGQTVIAQGQKADGLYLIVSGTVAVTRTDQEGNTIQLAELHESDIFGEISLLTQKPVTATVITLRTCRMLRLPKIRFSELIMTHPQILELVSRLSDERLMALNEVTESVIASGNGEGSALL